MIHALLLFASLAHGQALPQKATINEDLDGSYQTQLIDQLGLSLDSLLRGRPTISSFITTLGSFTFVNIGSGILWADGTISTSAASATGGPPTGLAGGDLTGLYPSPTLKPTQGNVLTFTSPITFVSSVTVQSNDFSVGGNDIFVTGDQVGIGAAPTEKLTISGSSMLLDSTALGTGASLNINAFAGSNSALILKNGGTTRANLFYEQSTGTITFNSTGSSGRGILIDQSDRVTINPALTAFDVIYATAPIIDIRAYGAIPNDGISDSTPTQRALNSLTTTGGTLLIPNGTWYFDQFRLTYISTKPIQIECRGWGSVLQFNPANDTPPSSPGHFGQLNIHGVSNSSHTAQVVIKNCNFDFGKSSAAVYNTNHQGINIHNADNVYILNNRLTGAAGEMLSLGNFMVTNSAADPDVPGERAWVLNNYFSNCVQSAANPSMDDTTFLDNHLQDCGIESTGRRQTYSNNTFNRTRNGAITISSGEQFVISDNRMSDCDIGAASRGSLYGCIALVGQGGGGGMFDGSITGNVITNSTRPQSQFTSGIYTTLGTNTQATQRISITDNKISNSYRGMYLTSITSSSISGNTITDQTASCIEIPGISPTIAQGSFTVVNNFFANCGIKDVDLNIAYSTQNIKVGPNWNPVDNTFTFSATSMTHLGKLGIGTSRPEADIHVGVPGGTTKVVRLSAGNSYDIESLTSGYFDIKNFDTGVPILTGDNAGRVGIGNTQPATALHISSGILTLDGNPTISLTANRGASFATSNGNVGIGVSSPNAKLELNGNLLFTNKVDRTISISSDPSAGRTLTIAAGDTTSGAGGDLILNSGDTTAVGAATGNIYIYPADANIDGNIIIGHTGGALRGLTCIGCASPINTLDVGRGMVVGSGYAGISLAPANGLIVSGRIGSNAVTPATQLDIGGSAQFGASVRKSTFTSAADLVMASGSSITQSGANGFFTNSSSITGSSFFGSGANLSGIPSSGSIVGVYLPLTGGTLTGQLTTTSSVTVQTAFQVGGGTLTVSSAGFVTTNGGVIGTGNLTSCGVTPSVATGSNNNSGKITLGVGGATACVMTFSGTWPNGRAPSCVVTNETTANLFRATPTSTQVTFSGTGLGSDVLGYICLGM